MAKSKKSGSKGFSASPWSRVSAEIGQGWELRRPLIENIGNELEAKVIVYFTSPSKEEAMIADNDAEMIETILSSEHTAGGQIDLILNCMGG